MSSALSSDAVYDAFLAEGRFMIQRSRGSGRYIFFPRLVEPVTGSADLEWVQPSGRATVYSTTTVHAKGSAPYNIALVDLDEGPRMMSRVVDIEPANVIIGMRVEARIVREDGKPLLVFAPTQQ